MIVADEPTGNLDPISTWDIVQLLLKINSFGTTIILATHNKDIVDKVNRRVIAMDRGRVIRDHAKGKYAIYSDSNTRMRHSNDSNNIFESLEFPPVGGISILESSQLN